MRFFDCREATVLGVPAAITSSSWSASFALLFLLSGMDDKIRWGIFGILMGTGIFSVGIFGISLGIVVKMRISQQQAAQLPIMPPILSRKS